MTFISATWLIIINILAWGFFHYFISYLCFKIPLNYFKKDSKLFRIRSWEHSGKIWQKLFRVKKWKSRIIEGSSIAKQSYDKNHLHGKRVNDLAVFAAETKRAELTHWLLIIPAPLFFLWNPIWAGWVMIIYALVANLPFIVVQRYNRGRIEVILNKL